MFQTVCGGEILYFHDICMIMRVAANNEALTEGFVFCDGWSTEIKPSFWRHAMYTQCWFEAIDPHSCANTRIGHCEFWHAAEAFQLGNVGLNESCL